MDPQPQQDNSGLQFVGGWFVMLCLGGIFIWRFVLSVYTPEVYTPEVYTPEVYTPEVYTPNATMEEAVEMVKTVDYPMVSSLPLRINWVKEPRALSDSELGNFLVQITGTTSTQIAVFDIPNPRQQKDACTKKGCVAYCAKNSTSPLCTMYAFEVGTIVAPDYLQGSTLYQFHTPAVDYDTQNIPIPFTYRHISYGYFDQAEKTFILLDNPPVQEYYPHVFGGVKYTDMSWLGTVPLYSIEL